MCHIEIATTTSCTYQQLHRGWAFIGEESSGKATVTTIFQADLDH